MRTCGNHQEAWRIGIPNQIRPYDKDESFVRAEMDLSPQALRQKNTSIGRIISMTKTTDRVFIQICLGSGMPSDDQSKVTSGSSSLSRTSLNKSASWRVN